MKAVFKAKPGPGIEVKEAERPEVKPSEVVVRVRACAICGTDIDRYLWVGEYPRTMAKYLPVILGHEFAGEIVEVGKNARGWKVGDRVAVEPLVSCGTCLHCAAGRPNHCKNMMLVGGRLNGGMAEFVVVPASNCFALPDNVSYDASSQLQTLAMAIHALERSPVMPGDNVVVLGPGPVGLLLAQAAVAVGATRILVTGLKKDDKRLKIARKLGAEPINVGDVDAIELVAQLTDGVGADVVFEASGSPTAARDAFEIVRPRGCINFVGLVHEPISVNLEKLVLREIQTCGTRSRGNFRGNWRRAISLVTAGKVDLDCLIDFTVPIDRANEGFEALVERKAVGVAIKP